MNQIRIQNVAIIIIKERDKILLQKNIKWKDLSFIGGKYEVVDNDIVTTAYREASEELYLSPDLDFTLSPLEPREIQFKNISDRTNEIIHYLISPFFMKLSFNQREKISNDENYWISLTDIENNNPQKISKLVIEIIPKLALLTRDSFMEYGQQ